MYSVNMLSRNQLSKIGIGSWGIGGFAERDPKVDVQKQIDALAYMFQRGMNFVEVNLWYSQGYAAELVARALKQSGKRREDIFICQAVYLKDQTLNDVEGEVLKVCELFETEYVDSLQFTQSVFLTYGFDRVCEVVDRVFEKGLSRCTSITNEPLELLKQYHERFGDKLFSHEVCFNFEIRENETNGVIEYANQNNILTVVYQPLRRNRTALKNWPLLVELSKKYGVTQNQIILAWIVSKGFLPLTKSENIKHVDEHLATLDITLAPEDVVRLNAFIPPGYAPLKVDWNKTGDGVRIDQLSIVFDEEYEKQMKSS